MENDLIRRSAAENIFRNARRAMKPENYSGQEFFIRDNILLNAEQIVHSIPSVDAVERAVYEQVAWERDIAVKQLADIGKSLGEKMDDVTKVVRCPKCRHSDFGGTYCKLDKDEVHPSYFCGRGQRREDGDA